MVVLGGTYQSTLIDPAPIPADDNMWSYDLESGSWAKIIPRNATLEMETGKLKGSEVSPWNLVHHTAFKVDHEVLGVVWCDNQSLGLAANELAQNEQVNARSTMVSLFNFKTNLWRNLKIACLPGQGYDDIETVKFDFQYRYGASLYPIFDYECSCVNKILLFGGIDLRKPALDDSDEHKNDLPYI